MEVTPSRYRGVSMIVPSQMQVLTAASRRPPTGVPIHRLPRRHRRALAADDVTIRAATRRDDDVVGRLEQLDGRVLTPGMRLLAELGGVTVAAIAVADDTV